MLCEQPTERHAFVSYLKRWDEYLRVSRYSVELSARKLNPVELQLQAICDILHHQRKRYHDRIMHQRLFPMQPPLVAALGVELASEMEGLISRHENYGVERKGWFHTAVWSRNRTMRQAENFQTFEREAFQTLSRHWERQGYVRPEETVSDSCDAAINNCSIRNRSETVPYLISWEEQDASIGDSSQINAREGNQQGLKRNHTLSLAALDRISSHLKTYGVFATAIFLRVGSGVAVLRNAVDKQDVWAIRRMLHLNGSMARESAYKIVEYDPNVLVLKHTRGRIHCLLQGTSFDRQLVALQQFWMPIIYYTLGRHFYVSNINLISSDPMSYVEPWHRKNRHFGICILLSLDDINEKTGRMQFLPGTHRSGSEINPYSTGKAAVDLNIGDVLIFDSRLLHRNTSEFNDSARCQSCLLYTYDYTSTPPPGQGVNICVTDVKITVMQGLLSLCWITCEASSSMCCPTHRHNFGDM
ncbi:hypothetical protein BBBOND_0105590 [Babesia bigemina]|uniref:Phytanoyl-CoA dioxygenase family protein n=1 Tax=Babesia bigemina TaxID=5866 RepID=A0A061D952_BABBI|nr:hypothetical protein BBBOND_0105590 [Babesia bigemina]CDR94250.1 hypothetical protein BBBOND_0105590 [Babesia bigemina]|eukprot:XP_012766436.1 hypothetical protein BBBOND_0105590 [Babesia bigemina]